MIRIVQIALLLAILIPLGMALTSPLSAQTGIPTQAEKGAAQVQMSNRVLGKLRGEALELGLNYEWVEYCRLETQAKSASYPEGSVLRYNYNSIASTGELNAIIGAREIFETQQSILCLHTVARTIFGTPKP